jgi:hypothetical protein
MLNNSLIVFMDESGIKLIVLFQHGILFLLADAD